MLLEFAYQDTARTLLCFSSFTILSQSWSMLISIRRDGQLPAVVLGLFLHLVVIYGVTNKPFSHVSSGIHIS